MEKLLAFIEKNKLYKSDLCRLVVRDNKMQETDLVTSESKSVSIIVDYVDYYLLAYFYKNSDQDEIREKNIVLRE